MLEAFQSVSGFAWGLVCGSGLMGVFIGLFMAGLSQAAGSDRRRAGHDL